MKNYKSVLVLCLVGFLLYASNLHQTTATLAPLYPSFQIQAHLITVRLSSRIISGSGVIVKHDSNRYTILTCNHVISKIKNEPYQVLVADGKSYLADAKTYRKIEGLDLATIQFDSPVNYSVAAFEYKNNNRIDMEVVIAGYPNWRYEQNNWVNTLKHGIKYFLSSEGSIAIVLKKPLEEGYQLGISNDVEIGMSGGPVLNSHKKLIGIIGRTKYPIAGIEAYTFIDGTKPDQQLLSKLEDVSWAMPLDRKVIAKVQGYENFDQH